MSAQQAQSLQASPIKSGRIAEPAVSDDASTENTNNINLQDNALDNILDRYQSGEELILAVNLDSSDIGEVFAIVQDNGLFIELDSFIQVLDFPIVKQNSQYIGWYIREEFVFNLQFGDISSETAVIYDDRETILNTKQFKVIDSIPFIHTNLIQEIFKITSYLDASAQQLVITPSITLPLQERLRRRDKRAQNRRAENIARYPELFRGYEILSPQTFDLSANILYSENTDKLQGNYSVLGRREIAYANTRFFFSGTENEAVANARINFSKRNINSPVMDWLGIERLEFGDVTPVATGITSTGGQAAGLSFTNIQRTKASNQQNISIAGEVLAGWDVELYRNDVLVGQLFDHQTGRYEFNDVQLFVGENQFEIVKYGPQGEIERESLSRYLAQDRQISNKWNYSASLTKPNSSLLGVDNLPDNPDVNDLSLALSTSKSITNTTAIRLGFVSDIFDGRSDNTYNIGIDGRFTDRTFFNINAQDNVVNQSAGFGLRTSLFGHQANISATSIRNKATAISTETRSNVVNIENRGFVGLSNQTRLSYQNSVLLANNPSTDSIRVRNIIGLQSPLGRLNHTLVYNDIRSSNEDTNNQNENSSTIGSVSYSNRFWLIFARLNASYTIDDSEEDISGISAYSIDLSYKHNQDLSFNYEANYQKRRDLFSQRLNINWLHKASIISANLSHSDLLGFGAGITARISMGGEPFNTDVFYQNRSLTYNGTIIVRVFLDENMNGSYDIGEEFIENAKVLAEQNYASEFTDKKGIAIINQLGTIAATDITVDASETDNPFLKPLIEGVSIRPREGFIDKLDFPMVETSEIEGTIYSVDDNHKATAYLDVNLINEKGEIVQTVKSEYDGYFFFSDIKPGKYRLTLSESLLAARRLKQTRYGEISIKGLSDIFIVDDIQVAAIEYSKVYFAKIAEFNNPQILNSYAGILKYKIRHPEIHKLKRLTSRNSDKHSLVSEGHSNQIDALALCEIYRSLRLKCSIYEQEVPTTMTYNIGTKIAQ
jgi:hypothetical protein